MKTFSGFTTQTAENLLLDAGAFFINFDPASDTYESAVAAGKLLGATRGGGEFQAMMQIRQIEVDGVKGRAKGLERNDAWDIYLKANVLELNETIIKRALGSAVVTTSTVATGYDEITGLTDISLADYVDNVTWVGKLAKTDTPVIIQVYNALSNDGLKITMQDKNEAVVPMTFYAHYTQDQLQTAPYKIYWPHETHFYTVAFNSNGGSSVASQTVEEGEKATQPTAPTKDGYTFGGWYEDAELTDAWTFASDTVQGDMVLYAKWE